MTIVQDPALTRGAGARANVENAKNCKLQGPAEAGRQPHLRPPCRVNDLRAGFGDWFQRTLRLNGGGSLSGSTRACAGRPAEGCPTINVETPGSARLVEEAGNRFKLCTKIG